MRRISVGRLKESDDDESSGGFSTQSDQMKQLPEAQNLDLEDDDDQGSEKQNLLETPSAQKSGQNQLLNLNIVIPAPTTIWSKRLSQQLSAEKSEPKSAMNSPRGEHNQPSQAQGSTFRRQHHESADPIMVTHRSGNPNNPLEQDSSVKMVPSTSVIEVPSSPTSEDSNNLILPKKTTNDPFYDKMMQYFNDLELKLYLKAGKSRIYYKRMKKTEQREKEERA